MAYPCFIDIEASGLGDESYPISVAWNKPSGEIIHMLIKPVPSWTDWSDQAETIHQIDRERLQTNGWAADYVLERLHTALSGQRVYSDAPEYDNDWLEKLFRACGQQSSFRIESAEEAFVKVLKEEHELQYQAALKYTTIREEISILREGQHHAGADVGFLIQCWNRATGITVVRNHSVGRLPRVSKTGSFLSLKGRVLDPQDAKAMPPSIALTPKPKLA